MTTWGKKVTLVCFGLVVVCVLSLLSLKIVSKRHLARARQIQIGDSMEKVRSLLGSPVYTSAGFLFFQPSWSYGSRLNFDSEFPWVQIRLFGPHTNDLAFYFDASSNVTRIQIPQR